MTLAPFFTAGLSHGAPRRLAPPLLSLPSPDLFRASPVLRGQSRLMGREALGGQVPAVPALPLALAGLLVLLAVLLAPEQPRHQEAICQRHAGVEACRVW